jgi:hypothetical protein
MAATSIGGSFWALAGAAANPAAMARPAAAMKARRVRLWMFMSDTPLMLLRQ